jgi:hypothetical protein
MEAACSSESSVDFQQTTRCYIRCEDLKSYTIPTLPDYVHPFLQIRNFSLGFQIKIL